MTQKELVLLSLLLPEKATERHGVYPKRPTPQPQSSEEDRGS